MLGSDLRLLALPLIAIALVGCSGLIGGPTPTPDPCSAGEIERYLDAIRDVSRRFDDAVALANTTPRGSLPPVIADLQEIRRDAEDLDVPGCADKAKNALVRYMDGIVDAFLLFLGNRPDSDVNEAFTEATDLLDAYLEAIAEVSSP